MNPLYAAAVEIQAFFESRGWRFCIIGGLAVVRWGEPRATRDVDVSLFAELGSEEQYIDPLLQQFAARIPDARDFALQHRVLLLRASNGIEIDVTLAAFPVEEAMVDRATPFKYEEGVELLTVSAEDLFVLKAIAGRDQDWLDAESIAVRQSEALDWTLIDQQLADLAGLLNGSDAVERAAAIRRRAKT
ncbi:MAG: nucleotidyltransferase [Planctomycetes bacterium]|nr:nucleotidyltransferase [Planctomycetota bacterium]